MKIAPRSKFVLIGDSITDAGRDPSGETTPWQGAGLGHGYAALVEAWLSSAYPEARIRVINRGVSGNTVRDLKARWQNDVLDLRPDWLAVMIGINDVWRRFDTPLRTETHVSLEEYTETLDALLGAVRPTLQGLILATPYVIDANRAEPMREMMDRYGAAVRSLAEKYKALFVDTQATMDALLGHTAATAIAWDRIHPGPMGHMALARAFLGALGAL